ncbi:MAG: phospholipase D-like domain-containing protein [Bacteroidota bacterium]
MNDIITNGSEIKQRIVQEISSAKQSVKLAMAWFTDRDIAGAIIAAKNRQVNVDILLSSNVQNETVKQMFTAAGVPVHAFETGDERGMMHHKFCLIDNRLTINGSYNYSYNASNNNVENIHLSDDTATHRQFLAEFDRLKYNIDNNIPLSTNAQTSKLSEPVEPVDAAESFSQHLHNLVYLAAQIDTEEYKIKGYDKSRESFGSVPIFKAEYNNIKEQISLFAIDDSIGSKKNVLTSNINTAFESEKTNLEADKQNLINTIKSANEIERRHITDEVARFKAEKSVLESGNQNTGVNGLIQVNKEIELKKLERRGLEQSFIIKPFATIGTILVSVFLTICLFYLSIFFASAIYKVFFEANIISASLEAGGTPPLPQLVDANAIIKIFQQQGTLFGIISGLIFLFPLALTNMKVLGSEKRWVNTSCFWVGLMVFDILVSAMVAINTDNIKSLLKGQPPTMQLWEVVKQGEFYLIFVFGMLPLFITHFLVEYVTKAYRNSRKEIVDAEKARKLQVLEADLLELYTSQEIVNGKIRAMDDSIKSANAQISNFEIEINSQLNQTETRYLALHQNIKAIFDDYNAKISSGKIFTDVVLTSIISAFKTGFIDYLPQFYAAEEVARRVADIEQSIINN